MIWIIQDSGLKEDSPKFFQKRIEWHDYIVQANNNQFELLLFFFIIFITYFIN